MRHKDIDPPEALRNLIRGIWYLEQDFGPSPLPFEVLPDGHAEIIFHFGGGLSRMKDTVLQELPSPFIVGLLDQTVHFYAKDRLQIIGIKCFPWAVYTLLDLPAVKGGVQVFKHPLAGLHAHLDALISAGRIDEALQVVINWFVQAGFNVNMPVELEKAGQAMLKANGNLPARSVAEAAHATIRTLERKFKASSGYTIQDVSGLMRFEQVRDRLWCNPDAAIAGVA